MPTCPPEQDNNLGHIVVSPDGLTKRKIGKSALFFSLRPRLFNFHECAAIPEVTGETASVKFRVSTE